MRKRRLSQHKNLSQSVEEVIDIDVTPVMNMFVVLIPFLISMAVFSHIVVQKFSLPPNSSSSLNQSKGPTKLKLTVTISPNYMLITRGGKLIDSLKYGEYEKLSEILLEIKANDTLNSAVVSVNDSIEFQDVITVMDKCRESGYTKVGISSQAINNEE